MRIVGIIGGIASGKSRLADQFRDWGAVVLDADSIGHELLNRPDIAQAIRERWGDQVFNDAGDVDRKKLAASVFRSPESHENRELLALESLLHPEIRRRVEEEIGQAIARKESVLVIDAPLLIEAGWNEICNEILFVNAPEELRLARARRRGWTDEEFRHRELAQVSLQQKKQAATFVIDNSGDWSETIRTARQLWNCWLSEGKSGKEDHLAGGLN
ncbi:MAG TPA: dephospho-CoA kinase [Pirellulaceae bacterium]|nr:dephospho-CoA kinase [Pirellulaceae bacterium]HMO92342.1 dephospho-CoA kinase [Pirellulaceae bacterium]HMP69266.1 dephospho-CoA kinase [Pirellulaceae bacterium]